MKRIKCEKRNTYKILYSYNLIFVLIGSLIVILAFFVPIFYWFLGPPYYSRSIVQTNKLWIFGWYEQFSVYTIDKAEWFGLASEDKGGVALISISLTITISILVMGTIFTSLYAFIRKRKTGVLSSRSFLYYSLGIYGAVNLYIFMMVFYGYESESFRWLYYYLSVSTPGAILFLLGSLFILMGYTLKAKTLLQTASLYVAGIFIQYGLLNITILSSEYISITSQVSSEFYDYLMLYFLLQLTRVGPSSIIGLVCALAIVLTNYRLYKISKKSTPIVK